MQQMQEEIRYSWKKYACERSHQTEFRCVTCNEKFSSVNAHKAHYKSVAYKAKMKVAREAKKVAKETKKVAKKAKKNAKKLPKGKTVRKASAQKTPTQKTSTRKASPRKTVARKASI